MQADIIRIGNSRGLRIPKSILEQCGLRQRVNIQVSDHSLIITPCEESRMGWNEAFQLMAHNKDDAPLDSDFISSSWDDEKWQW